MNNPITCRPCPAAVGDAPTDGELVARWAAGTDPVALEALIRRHGGMVLGVCRRKLGNTADADDAFQGTFLVLVRKAGSLAKPEQVAGWLHGVALRVATRVRDERARRHRREGTIVDVPAPAPPEDTRELRRVLDEELDRLPEKYRLPIVLCELEGRTLEEAARLLGWPKGTVAGRLSRGRELLRRRLSRRQVFVFPLFVGGSAPDFTPAAPPEPLVAATIESATAPRPARRSFWRSRLLGLVFLGVALGAGGAFAMHRGTGDPSRPSGVKPSPGCASPTDPGHVAPPCSKPKD